MNFFQHIGMLIREIFCHFPTYPI